MTGRSENQNSHRRIVYDDDSGFFGAVEPPMRPSDLQAVIDHLADTSITSYAWSNGTGNLVHHPSKVVEILGAGIEGPYRRELGESTWAYRCNENTHHLIASGCDPVSLLVERCHHWNIEFLYDVRMNDMHENAPICAWVRTPFKVKHPELLLGEAGAGVGWVSKNAEKQFNWAFDFAHQQVRDLRLAQFQEVIENYDIDGLSLDFMRGPTYFLPGQAEKNLDKMTDLIRQTQSLLQKKSESVGRKLVLLVRVPPYLEGCRQIGLDVPAWINQSLVDIVVPASCRRENMNLQASSFLELTSGRPCQVLAGLEHADHYGALTAEMYRAAAQRYWRDGVDGLYLFNMCCRGHNPPAAQEYLILREIADPERIAQLDKHYIVARRWNDASHDRIAEAADPPTQLPEELGPDPAELIVNVQLDDDFDGAGQDGVLQDVTVWVRFKDMFPTLDCLSFSWNAQQVADEQRHDTEVTPGEIWVSLDVTRMQINTGANELIIQLSKRAPDLAFGLTVYDVEATVRYRPRMRWGRSPRPASWYRPRGE